MIDDGRNGVDEAIVEVERVCRGGAPEYPWAVAKLLADELRRYREREPLVQKLLSVWAMGWTNNAGNGGVTLDMVDEAVKAVRGFNPSASAAEADESS